MSTVQLLSVTPLEDGIWNVTVSSEDNREQRSEEINHTRRKDSVKSRESEAGSDAQISYIPMQKEDTVPDLTAGYNRNDGENTIVNPEQESQCNTENVESEDRTLSPGDTMMSGSAPESSPMVMSPDRNIKIERQSEEEHPGAVPDDQGNMGFCSVYALAKALCNGFKTKKFIKSQDLCFDQGGTALVLVNKHEVV